MKEITYIVSIPQTCIAHIAVEASSPEEAFQLVLDDSPRCIYEDSTTNDLGPSIENPWYVSDEDTGEEIVFTDKTPKE